MSGIAGILYRNSTPAREEELLMMQAKLSHRGIDGIKSYLSRSVGLIHFMLHDTPESLLENLPYTSADGHFTITFDGRLDNREELAEMTGWQKPLKQTADGNLVLEAYKKLGKNCGTHLLGDFAFAIWDETANTLFCARDYIGVKPFYYYLDHNIFVFASEIKGLLSLPQVPKELNKDRIFDHLTFFATDKVSTFYKNILRLEPGSSLLLQGKKQYITQYSKPEPLPITCKTDRDYEEQFRELFLKAVQCRLRAHNPIGTYLSGGLDSSSITCIAAQELATHGMAPLHTFSGIFETVTECDERHYIDSVLERYPLKPHFIIVDELKAGSLFDSILEVIDEPFFGAHAYMMQELVCNINASGIRVVLDGHDGDGVVSYGNNLLVDLARSGKIIKLFRELKAEQFGSTVDVLKTILKIYRNIYRHSSNSYQIKWALNYIDKLAEIVSIELKKSTDLAAKAMLLLRHFPLPLQKESERHLRIITQPVQTAALELMDLISAHKAVVPRYPFFDKRVVNFCLALPPEQKRRLGVRRSILRRALVQDLPPMISQRKKKTEFSPSIIHSFTKTDRKWLPSVIDSADKEGYKYLDKEHLEDIRKKMYSTNDDIVIGDVKSLITAAILFKWLDNISHTS